MKLLVNIAIMICLVFISYYSGYYLAYYSEVKNEKVNIDDTYRRELWHSILREGR